MRLGPGEYFGGTKWSRQVRGVLLTISTYQASQTQPWHCHANPTFFVLLTGKHRDHTRCADVDQSALSLVFHPTTNPHAGEVGPLGMRGMNIEYPAEWLERHGLGDEDLSRYRPLESAGARLSVLQVLATAFQPGDQMDAEIETLVLELLAQVVSWPEPVIESFAPKWLRTAEEFL